MKKESQKMETPVVILGNRYKCYKCGTRFYDLGKPQPLCPTCGEDQNNDEAKRTHNRKRRRRPFSMGKSEHAITAPEERDVAIEVVHEVDTEYALDVEDIVLEESTDTDEK